jgi:hypothetical protein
MRMHPTNTPYVKQYDSDGTPLPLIGDYLNSGYNRQQRKIGRKNKKNNRKITLGRMRNDTGSTDGIQFIYGKRSYINPGKGFNPLKVQLKKQEAYEQARIKKNVRVLNLRNFGETEYSYALRMDNPYVLAEK